jgi:hypothetical protein
LDGYYVYVIAKSTKIGDVGGHGIYRIDDTRLISIASPLAKTDRNPDEQRYRFPIRLPRIIIIIVIFISSFHSIEVQLIILLF